MVMDFSSNEKRRLPPVKKGLRFVSGVIPSYARQIAFIPSQTAMRTPRPCTQSKQAPETQPENRQRLWGL